MTVPKVAPTTLDGWPAETGRVEAGRCPTLSVRVGPALTRDQPGVLTAAQLGNSRAVLVSVWASDATTLDSWLPAGSQILQSTHFFDPAKTGH